MRYEECAPPPELRDLVHQVRLLRGAPAAGRAGFQRAMPDGTAELIFNLADPFESRDGTRVRRQPLSLVVGPTPRAMEIRATGAVDLAGAVGELPLALDPTLAEQLAALSDHRRIGAAVDLAPAGHPPRPAAIPRTVGMSHRQLSRVFRQGYYDQAGRYLREAREIARNFIADVGRRSVSSRAERGIASLRE